MREYRELADIARAAAEQAAEHIRRAKRPAAGSAWTPKGGLDYVTEVDRRSEVIIADALAHATPEATVQGEELSPDAGTGSLAWVVDPLDGTANYLHDYPQYAVSIAAMVDGALAAAVVLDVARALTYTATLGGGAWCGSERLNVSAVAEPGMALIGTGFPFRTPHLVPRYLRQFAAINAATSGIRRAGSAALDLADVARGRFEGFWELELAAWDVAAGTLLVREAGGHVTDLAGSPEVVRRGPIVAGNPAIHGWLLRLLEEQG